MTDYAHAAAQCKNRCWERMNEMTTFLLRMRTRSKLCLQLVNVVKPVGQAGDGWQPSLGWVHYE